MKTSTICRRPPRGTPKEELRRLHKEKMMGKFFRNREFGSYISYHPFPRPAVGLKQTKGKK